MLKKEDILLISTATIESIILSLWMNEIMNRMCMYRLRIKVEYTINHEWSS